MKFLKFGNSKRYIVFLHGWGADKNSFLWVKNYFQDYSLLFVDFPGFGESSIPDGNYRLVDYVDELKFLLDEFEIDELVLVGHSFGGRVAIKFCFLYQDDYQKIKLCLIDSAGIKPRRGLKYYIKVKTYKRYKKKALFSDKYKTKLEKFGSNDYKNLPAEMRRIFVNVVNEDLTSCAKFIKCKTLIIWGDHDFETPKYMARKLNKLIVKSNLCFISNAGHFSFLDNKQEFLFLLDTFLKN